MPKIKDTYLSTIKPGDILMYRAGSLLWPDFDVLGAIIATFEGNQGTSRDSNAKGASRGDYTHCAWVRDVPDPEAEVVEVRPGIFRVEDREVREETVQLISKWSDQKKFQILKRSGSGIRVHSTWPCVREDIIEWENAHMEVWRIRRATEATIDGILKLANDMVGYQYDAADFVSFGNLHLPSARKCSDFISDLAYNASILLSDEEPICLTPNISGNQDQQVTPNDLINSGELVKIKFQGLL